MRVSLLGSPTSTGGGNTRFTEALDALAATPGFEKVQKILVVADNDVDPLAEFQKIVAAVNATAPIMGPPATKLSAAAAPLEKSNSNPQVVILMLPVDFSPG